MLGVALLGLGVFFFVTPERGYVLQVLVQFWPLFLILAGVVRVTGHLIDRHPRSPGGGLMLTAVGGILLAANLRGEHSLLFIFGRYWFWLLLALIAGRVIRQYTHRAEDGPRPRTLGLGTVLLILLIVGGGLAANRASASSQLFSRLRLRLGQFGDVRDYVFGDQQTVDDEPATTFALPPNARLVIGNVYGDVEVRGGSEPFARAKLIKRIRAVTEEDARRAAQNIHLQVTPAGNLYQFSVSAEGKDFNTTLILELPRGARAGFEIENPPGRVKLSGLRGDHTLQNCDRVEVIDNVGRVTVNNPRGPVQLSRIQGEVSVTNARRDVSLHEIAGAVTLEAQGGSARIEQITGLVTARVNNGRVEIHDVRGAAVTGAAGRVINLEESRNSQVSVRNIEGGVAITASRSRIEAEGINGDLTIASSSERVHVNRVAGQLRINTDNGTVEAEDLRSVATIEATRDVAVRDFRGPLNVTTRFGNIRLATNAELGGDVHAVNQHGRIQVALPGNSSFRLDASTVFGKLRLHGFPDLDVPRHQNTILATYSSNGATPPLLSLRSTNGQISIEASGLVLARHEEQDDQDK